MMIYLTYFAVFLCLNAAIFLVGGLDKKIAEEMRRGKKAGEMKLRRQTVFTRLARLEQEGRRLVREVTPMSWI